MSEDEQTQPVTARLPARFGLILNYLAMIGHAGLKSRSAQIERLIRQGLEQEFGDLDELERKANRFFKKK